MFTCRHMLTVVLSYVLICGYMFNMFVSICSSPYDVTYTHLCKVLHGQIYVFIYVGFMCIYLHRCGAAILHSFIASDIQQMRDFSNCLLSCKMKALLAAAMSFGSEVLTVCF